MIPNRQKLQTTADRLTSVAPTLRRHGYTVRKTPQRPIWSVTNCDGNTARIQYDTRAGFVVSGGGDTEMHTELHRLLGN